MKIYTKTGDKGETSLFGGKRVKKDDARIEAYGTVDELNSVLGLVSSFTENKEIKEIVENLQQQLFTVGADLATPIEKTDSKRIKRVSEELTIELEKLVDNVDEKIPELRNFILPGGNKAASLLHFARTICRRAERRVIALSEKENINDAIVVYLNRLSDLLFVMARYENYLSGTKEIDWEV